MDSTTRLAITGIEAELDRLKQRIEVLENPVPVPPPPPQPYTWPPTSETRWGCSLCGLTTNGGLLSYTCPYPNCPTGLGPVMCKADNQ